MIYVLSIGSIQVLHGGHLRLLQNTQSRRSKSKPETKCISRKRPQFQRGATDKDA